MYLLINPSENPMEAAFTGDAVSDGGGGSEMSKSLAVITCTALAIFYVAILYSPTLILRLQPPDSFQSYMIRRFICAAISSVFSLIACSLILPIQWGKSHLFSVYGIRLDHMWQAVVFPLTLTSLMYAGTLILKLLLLLDSGQEDRENGRSLSLDSIKNVVYEFIESTFSLASDISAWRNYLVAPLTEELVFRACMIPLLLCGGFSTYTVVFLCPIFFSLAHLNHLLEYAQRSGSWPKAFAVVGFQLGYTVIFGSYASFLFVRTGHLTAPLVAHIFCNYMGIPIIISRRTGMVTVASVAGLLGFLWLLFPLTTPHLYNAITDNCMCWHRYCSWS
ncbi:CAAX prenyl protease 2 isoform X1 [Nicotiana tabacum]|uniref:intramembrane prenyl-peptidase Rce1 n=1 Tax=Nicotiana tabacum TaxID=4097 RepID=A0A1S3XAI4_TOBAC|nr:PREDICTED: CAAX prenyl protease 2-like isoform X2 [Nicotiana tabacum]